jgi:hypothetical protein
MRSGKTGKLGAELGNIDEIRLTGLGPAAAFGFARHVGEIAGSRCIPNIRLREFRHRFRSNITREICAYLLLTVNLRMNQSIP